MIGHVVFELPDGEHLAFLAEDRNWRIDPPIISPDFPDVIMDVLEAIGDHYQGPHDGPFGPRELAKAARFLKGTAVIDLEWERRMAEGRSRPTPPRLCD